jgi:hypothetical protein
MRSAAASITSWNCWPAAFCDESRLMAILLDQAGSSLLDQAGNYLYDDAGAGETTPVSVLYYSAFDILIDVSVLKTSSFNIGQGVQTYMIQMAAVPWISTYPS